MKKLIAILFLFVGLNNTFAQQKFTPQQIEKVDKAILLAGDSDEDMQGLIEYTSTVLNISKQQSKEYIEKRCVDFFSSILTAEAKKEQLTKQKRVEMGIIYSTLIDKLHRGELLTEEEMNSFTSGKSYGRFWTVEGGGPTICLYPPQKPVAENNIMIYGNGNGRSDGNAHFLHYSATIKKVGTLETADAFYEMYTCTTHDGIKEAILGITWKNDKENRTHYSLRYVQYGIAHCSTFHFGGQSGTFKGFSESEIDKVKEIQNNLHEILVDGINEYLQNGWGWVSLFNKLIDNSSKQANKKPKAMPNGFEDNFFYIGDRNGYEVWSSFDPEYNYRNPATSQTDHILKALEYVRHQSNILEWRHQNSREIEYIFGEHYEGRLIIHLIEKLGNYYLNIDREKLITEISSLIFSNKQFWGNWQIENKGGKFPVILYHKESGKTFLFEESVYKCKRINLSNPLTK